MADKFEDIFLELPHGEHEDLVERILYIWEAKGEKRTPELEKRAEYIVTLYFNIQAAEKNGTL